MFSVETSCWGEMLESRVTGFPVWLVGTDSIPGPACGLGNVPSNPLEGYFPRFWQFHCTYKLTTCWILKGTPNRFLKSSLRAGLPCLLVYPENSACCHLPGSPVAQFWVCWALPGPPSQCTLGSSLQAARWDKGRAHLICFPSLKVHSFPAWCLVSWEPLFYILCLSCCCCCLGGRVIWGPSLILARGRSRHSLLILGSHAMSSWRGSCWRYQNHHVRENFEGEEWQQSSW